MLRTGILAAILMMIYCGTGHGQLFTYFSMEESDSPLVDFASGSTAEEVDEGHLYGEPGPAGFGNAVGLAANGSWQFDLPESQVFNIVANDFSVAAWVYLDSDILAIKDDGPNSALNRIFGDDVAWDADGWSFGVWNDGRIRFTKNGITDSDTAGSWVDIDEWSHIAATVSSTDGITIYHNGQVAQSWPDRTPNLNQWPGNNGEEDIWGVGRTYGNGESQWFAGFIDELRVYANVLSQEEVAALMIPPTVGGSCDVDGDSVCGVSDIDMIFATGDIAAGVAAEGGTATDVNGDGTVNMVDVDEWLLAAATENGFSMPYLVGDTNLDGSVDAQDLNAMAVNWLTSGRVWSTGDFTGEGEVNASDLNALAINWQQSIEPAAAAVPEPAAVIMLLTGLCFCRIRHRN